MNRKTVDIILYTLTAILIISSLLPIVYSVPRNVAEDPSQYNESQYVEEIPSIFNVSPHELDTKLLEIIQKMNEAINITKKVDSKTADLLEGIRDSFISNVATGNLKEAERDMKLFSEILDAVMKDPSYITNLDVDEYSRLQDLVVDLYTETYNPLEIGEIVNPPKDVTAPPPDVINDFNVSITPSISFTPTINTYFSGISYFITMILALTGVGILLYLNRDRLIKVFEDVSMRLGIRRRYPTYEIMDKNFYHVFLEIAKKKGYRKMDYEGPVEHVFRIDDDYLRKIGYEVAYTFEDIKYGMKKVEESRIERIRKMLRGER